MSAPRGSSLYDLLGVSKTATPTEIKKAYLKLARTHHPDKGGDPEKFKEIAQASEVLTDEIRRRRYDELGVTDDQPTGGSGFPFPFEMNVNIQDLFGNMFQGMGMGPMGMGGGGGPPGQNGVRKGKKPGPTIQTIPVRLEQYYLGHQFDIMIHRQAFCVPCDHTGARVKETCRRCHGSGSLTQVVQMGPMAMHTTGPCTECQGRGQKMIDSCPVCSGTGFTQQIRKLTVHIPAGTRPQETFIFPEVCSDHVAFEKPGDVHILLQEDLGDTSFKTFRRAGDQFQHLETTIHLTLAESLLGTVVQLDGHPGYDEGLFVEIPAGTFTKDVYALDGLGMPLVREKDKYGELHLMIEVTVSDEERLKMSGTGADALRQVLGGMVTPANCPAESIQRVARRV
jgi:DnaJ-class molecular chaperone